MLSLRNPRCLHLEDINPPQGLGFRVHFLWDNLPDQQILHIRETVIYSVIPSPPFSGANGIGMDPFSNQTICEPQPYPASGAAGFVVDGHWHQLDQLQTPPATEGQYSVEQYYEGRNEPGLTMTGNWVTLAHYQIQYKLYRSFGHWFFSVTKTGMAAPAIHRQWRWQQGQWINADDSRSPGRREVLAT